MFVVDWEVIANMNYLTAHATVDAVGEYLAMFISLMVEKYSLQLWNVKIVGHSLGAHVAGFAGSILFSQVGTIVGLDPAGPLFQKDDPNKRLDNTDAQFVEVSFTVDIRKK